MDTDKEDHFRYHVLYQEDGGEILYDSADSYKSLNENSIATTFSDLYDAEIERALGRADT